MGTRFFSLRPLCRVVIEAKSGPPVIESKTPKIVFGMKIWIAVDRLVFAAAVSAVGYRLLGVPAGVSFLCSTTKKKLPHTE